MNPNEPYDRIALAVGRVCYWWSGIEILTRDMCHHVAAIENGALLDPSVSPAFYILAENMGLREKIAALKTLACTALPVEHFNRFEALLNRIDNEIRNERNRFVHDIWNADENGIYRLKMGTGVRREQAFKVRVKILNEKVYGTIEEVEAFTAVVEKAYNDLAEFDALFASLAPKESAQELALRALRKK